MKNSEERPYKRSVIVIKRSLQFRFAALTMTLVSFACFMVWWETFRDLNGYKDKGFLSDPMLGLALHQINVVILIKVVALVLLVGGFSLLISHYIAGPLYRLEKSFEHLRTGDLTHRVRFRSRDGLQHMGDALNVTLNTLQKRLKKDYAKLHTIEDELSDLSKSSRDKVRNAKIQRIADEIKSITKSFKVFES